MRIYEIIDGENELSIGILLYYEKKKAFIIELQENLDEWTAPLLFTALVKKNQYTVPRDVSFLWVQERVIPIGRQNISDILKNHKLASYDEMKLLEISEGRCSQDSLYIKKTELLPDFAVKRREKNVVECIACERKELICFFADDTVKKINLNHLAHVKGVDKILEFDQLYQSCAVGVDGYAVTFNDSIDLPAGLLYDSGEVIPVSRNDFITFAKKNLLDTSECCQVLDCSRQNVAYMVKQQYLHPVKEEVKGNLYLKGDVLKNTW